MALYRLTHGSFKVGPREYLHAGDVIELTAAQAAQLGDAVLLSVPDVQAEVAALAEPTPLPAPKAKRAKR